MSLDSPATSTPDFVPKTQPTQLIPDPPPIPPPEPPDEPNPPPDNQNQVSPSTVDAMNEDKPCSAAHTNSPESPTPLWKDVLVAGGVSQPTFLFNKKAIKSKITTTFPNGEDGEPEVFIPPEVVAALAGVWKNSVVVKLLGPGLRLDLMEHKLRGLWNFGGSWQVVDLTQGCYLVRFEAAADVEKTLEGGPWSIFGRCLAVKRWTPGFRTSDPFTATTVWIRVLNLPITYYQEDILLSIVEGIGTPVRVDSKTTLANRGRFARISVQVNLDKPLKGSILVNKERFLVEYEGLPSICYSCGRFGHQTKDCQYKAESSGIPAELRPENQAAVGIAEQADNSGAKVDANTDKKNTGAGVLGEWMDRTCRRRSAAWKARKDELAKQAKRLSPEEASLNAEPIKGKERGRNSKPTPGARNQFSVLQGNVGMEESEGGKASDFCFNGKNGGNIEEKDRLKAGESLHNNKTPKMKKKAHEVAARAGLPSSGPNFQKKMESMGRAGEVEAQECDENPNLERNRRRRMRRKIRMYGKEAISVSEDSSKEGDGPNKKPKAHKYLKTGPREKESGHLTFGPSEDFQSKGKEAILGFNSKDGPDSSLGRMDCSNSHMEHQLGQNVEAINGKFWAGSNEEKEEGEGSNSANKPDEEMAGVDESSKGGVPTTPQEV